MTWKKPRISRRHSPTFATWHGTAAKFENFDINQCELGIHSGSIKQATDMISDRGDEGRILKLEVTLNNPLRLVDENSWRPSLVWNQLLGLGLVTDPDGKITSRVNADDPEYRDSFIRQTIESLGYDGVVYLNREEGLDDYDIKAISKFYKKNINREELTDEEYKGLIPSAHDSYIAFHPEQVKRLQL